MSTFKKYLSIIQEGKVPGFEYKDFKIEKFLDSGGMDETYYIHNKDSDSALLYKRSATGENGSMQEKGLTDREKKQLKDFMEKNRLTNEDKKSIQDMIENA